MCSLAVAQPLFDLLGRNASFFVAHRAEGIHILLLVAVALLGPATLLITLRVLIDLVSRRAGNVVHLASLGALGAIALVAPLVRGIGLGWILALPLAVAAAAIIAIAYARTNVLRRFLTILSPVVIVFPALFLFASPVRELLIVRSST